MKRAPASALLLAAACGSADQQDGPTVGPTGEAEAEAEAEAEGSAIDMCADAPLPDPAHLIRVSGGTAGSGGEIFRVDPVEIDNDAPIFVQAFELVAPVGLHHMRTFRLSEGDCATGADPSAYRHLYATSTGVHSDFYRFPCGLALEVPPRPRLCVDYHFLNAGDDPVDADVEIRVYTLPEREVRARVTLFGLEDDVISIPPGGGAEEMDCIWPEPFTLLTVIPHTHVFGVRQQVLRISAVGGEGEMLHEWTQLWDSPPHTFDPPIEFSQGQGIRVRCEYENETGDTIVWGPSAATDEMCILYGYIHGPEAEFFGGVREEALDKGCQVFSR